MRQLYIREQPHRDPVGVYIVSCLDEGLESLPDHILARLQAARFNALVAFSLRAKLTDSTQFSEAATLIGVNEKRQNTTDAC